MKINNLNELKIKANNFRGLKITTVQSGAVKMVEIARVMIIACIILFTVGYITTRPTITTSAAERSESEQSKTLTRYLEISKLSNQERAKYFEGLKAEEKSQLAKFHLALQSIKYRELNKDQKDLLIDAISQVSKDSFASNQTPIQRERAAMISQRMVMVFPFEQGNKIFNNYAGDADDIAILSKYKSIISTENVSNRKAEIDKSSPLEISLFYKIQMAFGMAMNQLSREQMNLILESMQVIRPELYINRDLEELKAKRELLKSLIERIRSGFSGDVGGAIFVNIGDIPTAAEETAICNCLADAWASGCSSNLTCQTGVCNDNPLNGTHCGIFGIFPCAGKCS